MFQGVKGGLLAWDPTVERRTTIASDDPGLTDAQRQDLRDGKKFSSRGGADAYVARLRQGIAREHPEHDHHDDPGPAGVDRAPDPGRAAAVSLTASQRRNSELGLGLLAVIITVGGYILVALSEGPRFPPTSGSSSPC